MKKLRPTLVLLTLLGLLGGGVALKQRADRQAGQRGDKARTLTEESPDGTRSGKRARSEDGDKERLSRVHGWLHQTEVNPGDPALWRSIHGTIGSLSLEAVKELLADREALKDVNLPPGSDDFQPGAYPLRFQIRVLLWQRYAVLAPDETLALAFPEGKPTADRFVQVEDVLYGVAKDNPRRAFEVWRTHYAGGSDSEFMTREPLEMTAWGLAAECAKQDPESIAAQLAEIGPGMRGRAYQGYASALGEQTDWAAEVQRLETLFPDSAQRKFTSQHPTASLACQWVQSDPAAAFAWIATLEKDPDYSLVQMGYSQVIADWMREEPADSVEFLKEWKAPAGNQDRLYSQVLSGYGSQDPAVANGVLELIQDPAQREAVARELIQGDSTSREVLRSLETSNRLPDRVKEEASIALSKAN